MSLLEKIDDDDYSASSRVLRSVIPGYDYRKREKRADTDRRVRDAIRTEISDAEKRLDDCRRELFEHDEELGKVAKLNRRLSTFAENVESAPGGGGFLNGDSSPDDEAMVELVKQDAKVIDALKDLQDRLDTMYEKKDADILSNVRKQLREVEDRFSEREKILKRL